MCHGFVLIILTKVKMSNLVFESAPFFSFTITGQRNAQYGPYVCMNSVQSKVKMEKNHTRFNFHSLG